MKAAICFVLLAAGACVGLVIGTAFPDHCGNFTWPLAVRVALMITVASVWAYAGMDMMVRHAIQRTEREIRSKS